MHSISEEQSILNQSIEEARGYAMALITFGFWYEIVKNDPRVCPDNAGALATIAAVLEKERQWIANWDIVSALNWPNLATDLVVVRRSTITLF